MTHITCTLLRFYPPLPQLTPTLDTPGHLNTRTHQVTTATVLETKVSHTLQCTYIHVHVHI